jgi:hypothetical protein
MIKAKMIARPFSFPRTLRSRAYEDCAYKGGHNMNKGEGAEEVLPTPELTGFKLFRPRFWVSAVLCLLYRFKIQGFLLYFI